MDVIIAIILVCGFLNIIPWLLLLYTRPDDRIFQKLDEDGSALAGILQQFMGRLADLEDLGNSLQPSTGEFDLGSIIAQIFAQKMNSEANDPYNRNSDGTFHGTPEIIETTPKND
jgi:hypothetical protein|tara:strand:- start:319 stop:663 length:345 start_codon:yes stop_codon:yes gene_type:complete